MRRTVKIGNGLVGDGHPCFIYVDIGINANGSIELAKQLIDAAVKAGADAVKFQKRTPELCVPEHQKNQKHEEMKQNHSERLDQAVTEGKITSEQKDQILAKLEDWHSKKEDLMNLTPEERKTKMQEMRTELESWVDENGIDMSLLLGFGHKIFMKGFHNGYMMGHW